MMSLVEMDIRVVDMHKHEQRTIYEFYRHHAIQDGIFVVLDEATFFERYQTATVLTCETTEIVGLLVGSMTTEKAYIGLCYGTNDVRTRLIKRFETLAEEAGLASVWIHFFNPIPIAWHVKEGVTHPMYQGVELDGELHRFYHALGYQDHSLQETYYRTLSDWVPIDAITKRLAQEAKFGFTVEVYDRTRHHGMKAFAEDVGHPGWKQAILEHLDHPFVVALYHERVVGFAGPLWVEPTGRGYFAGIGVLERHRGHGLGKGLFQMLLWWHREHGASYMTLFTGRDNPAGRIYKEQGFNIVKQFMTMKKDLKSAYRT